MSGRCEECYIGAMQGSVHWCDRKDPCTKFMNARDNHGLDTHGFFDEEANDGLLDT